MGPSRYWTSYPRRGTKAVTLRCKVISGNALRRSSVDRPEVLVEPVEDLADQIRPRDQVAMPAVVQNVPLVRLFRAEGAKQRFLVGLERKDEIVAPIHHEDGDPHSRREIPRVHLRRNVRVEPAR